MITHDSTWLTKHSCGSFRIRSTYPQTWNISRTQKSIFSPESLNRPTAGSFGLWSDCSLPVWRPPPVQSARVPPRASPRSWPERENDQKTYAQGDTDWEETQGGTHGLLGISFGDMYTYIYIIIYNYIYNISYVYIITVNMIFGCLWKWSVYPAQYGILFWGEWWWITRWINGWASQHRKFNWIHPRNNTFFGVQKKPNLYTRYIKYYQISFGFWASIF